MLALATAREHAATQIQAAVRAMVCRRDFEGALVKHRAAIAVQAAWRAAAARSHYARVLPRHRAALVIQVRAQEGRHARKRESWDGERIAA
jgi:hypothetical protein